MVTIGRSLLLLASGATALWGAFLLETRIHPASPLIIVTVLAGVFAELSVAVALGLFVMAVRRRKEGTR